MAKNRSQQSQQPQRPVVKFRSYGIEASVWKHENGYSVTIRKTYKNEDSGEYKETNTFFPDDLPRLALVANAAFEFVSLKSE